MIHFFQILGAGGEKFRVFAADSAVLQNNAPLWRIGKRNYRHDGFGLVKKCHGIFKFLRSHKGGGGIDAAEQVKAGAAGLIGPQDFGDYIIRGGIIICGLCRTHEGDCGSKAPGNGSNCLIIRGNHDLIKDV